MIRLTSISILLSILNIQCFCQQSDNDMILLINYNEYTSYEIVEIDGQKVNPSKHFYEEIQYISDDFSEFYPIKRVFYYDGEVDIKKNHKILFWDYDYKKEIDSLPFSYSKIKINTIVNDTVLKIQFNNKSIEIAPNEIKKDTMILTKKEKNKLVRQTTIIKIENLGLIEKKNVIDNKSWKTRSIELGINAPTFVEVMPEFEGGQSEFLKYMTEHIEYPTLDRTENINTKLVIEFVIDEHGEVAMTRILRSISPTFDNHVVEVLKNMPKWKPGMNGGMAVPVKMVIPITIELKE